MLTNGKSLGLRPCLACISYGECDLFCAPSPANTNTLALQPNKQHLLDLLKLTQEDTVWCHFYIRQPV